MRQFILILFCFLCFDLQAQEVANLQTEITEELSFEPYADSQVQGQNNFLLKNPSRQTKIVTKLLKVADEAFENMWYAEASKRYAEAFERTDGVPAMQALQKAADSYYFIGDMESASKWYGVLFDNYKDMLSKDDLFKYSHVLKGIGRKQNADRILNIISKSNFENVVKSPSFLRYERSVVLKGLKINTKYSEFGPTLKPDGKIIFASAADTGVFKTKRYKWNNQPFLDLYEATTGKNSYEFNSVTKLSKPINTKQHEASATFSPDGKTMYFTRNDDKRKKRSKKNVNHLKIFVSKYTDSWSEPIEVPFNNEGYSTGHPALSPDGKKLFFVSDMPGGQGFTDLYYVDVLENGRFSKPQNLGPGVNSNRK